MIYKVVLTHKIKTEVTADTPDAALETAQEKVKDLKFEPTTWNVEEQEDK